MPSRLENVRSARWAIKRALKDAYAHFVKRLPYWWSNRPDWRTIEECESCDCE